MKKSHVSGSVQRKGGYFHAVMRYTDNDGKKQTKWKATGFKVKGNLRRAEEKLEEFMDEIEYRLSVENDVTTQLFADHMYDWLETLKPKLAITTHACYLQKLNTDICPYFKKLGVTVGELKPGHIQDFYDHLRKKGQSESTVRRSHSCIFSALKKLYKAEKIASNPADKISKPKNDVYKANWYNASEVGHLIKLLVDDAISLPITIAAYYGLRRSETMGLKWGAIDFDGNQITIHHTVTSCMVDGKYTVVKKDRTKTKSSHRTLPLLPEVKEILLMAKQRQEENKRIFKRAYINTDYVCVFDNGEPMKPGYVSVRFTDMLKKLGMRHIRFHDLRHSCASILLNKGCNLKDIQAWLGHSNYATTANLYAHLEENERKLYLAGMMEDILK
jgi:integrase